MSHKQQLQAQFSYNTTQVLWLTGITHKAYEHLIADTAAAWADHVAALVNPNTLLSSPLFLSWWFHNWHMADDAFILPALYYTDNNRYAEYRVLHQFVFNADAEATKHLVADFRNLLPEFLKPVKTAVCK